MRLRGIRDCCRPDIHKLQTGHFAILMDCHRGILLVLLLLLRVIPFFQRVIPCLHVFRTHSLPDTAKETAATLPRHLQGHLLSQPGHNLTNRYLLPCILRFSSVRVNTARHPGRCQPQQHPERATSIRQAHLTRHVGTIHTSSTLACNLRC